ncbi:MAG: IS110 family transposase [Planctomycetaceae bacterium]|nr:MAG: IS110 family transposase [Planctomycetaceae bacterium]
MKNGKNGKSNNVYASVTGVGMDVHYKFSSVTMRDAHGIVVHRERLDHRDRSALRERLSRWPKNVPIAMEASFGWAWLADLMTELELNPELSNCYKIQQMRQARGWVKTNRKDADLLSLLPYEKSDWWKVWMSPPDVRDRREQMRHRADVVVIQTETKNRIWALFHRHGIFCEASDLFGVAGRKFLAELCAAGRTADVVLPPGALEALRSLLDLLNHIRMQLAKIARELRKQLARSDLAKRFDGIPGIALILAHTMIAEIGVLERFSSHRQLASYSLLAPRSNDTGEPDGRAPLGRHLGRRGNRTLKWAFIEAAHGAVRSGGKWRDIYDRATDGGERNRNRGYIKVARELVKVVYSMWRNGTSYMDNPPARPGAVCRPSVCRMTETSLALSSARSGTGQP